MTVIAWKNGIMACDSAWTSDGLRIASLPKIRRLKDGSLLGTAGDADDRDFVKLIERCIEREELPSKEELNSTNSDWIPALFAWIGHDTYVVTASKDVYACSIRLAGSIDGIDAIGAADSVAIGAMHAGASAEEACVIACKLNAYCKEPVIAVPLYLAPKKGKR